MCLTPPEGNAPRVANVRLVLTPAAEAAFAQLREQRRVANLRAVEAGEQSVSAGRLNKAVGREVYELVIRAFLERDRAGEHIAILAPPANAKRRGAWLDIEVKAELDALARRHNTTIGAVFYTATKAWLEGHLTPLSIAS
jgi:hypothetical protein